jgi:hypothetical protein
MPQFNVAEMANDTDMQAVYVGSTLTGVFIMEEFLQATATSIIDEITVTTIGNPGSLIVILVEDSKGVVYRHPKLAITERYHQKPFYLD